MARTEEHIFILTSEEEHTAKINGKISELQTKIDNSEKQYDNILENKIKGIKKVLTTYDDKEITPIAIAETQEDKRRINNDIINFKNEIENLKNLLPKPSTLEEQDKNDANIFVILDKSSDREKYDLIHKHIKCVSVCDATDRHLTKQINVETYIDDYTVETHIDDDIVDDKDELIKRMIEKRGKKTFYYDQQNKSISQYMATLNGEPVCENIPIVRRINSRQKNTLN